MNKYIGWIVAGALAFAASPLAAQDVKICTVDLQAALAQVDEGREALEELTGELQRRQEEINARQVELEEWMAELETQMAVLSPEQRAERMAEYEQRVADLQQMFAAHQQELGQAEIEATRRIADRMVEIVEALAAENSCSYMLQGSVVIYAASDANDFTEELVSTYNERY